jgi:hypothetical protein
MACQSSSIAKFPKIDRAFSFYPFFIELYLLFIISIIALTWKINIDFIVEHIKKALTGSRGLLGPYLVIIQPLLPNLPFDTFNGTLTNTSG